MNEMRRLPKLKRISINSELELDTWLSKNSNREEPVLIVTNTDASHQKHVSREQIASLLNKHGWQSGKAYNIGTSKLLGSEISKSA